MGGEREYEIDYETDGCDVCCPCARANSLLINLRNRSPVWLKEQYCHSAQIVCVHIFKQVDRNQVYVIKVPTPFEF